MTSSAALYLCVSTQEQSLLGRENEFRAYAFSRNWEIVRVFSEKVSATGKATRTEYEQLFAEAGSPERLVVTKLLPQCVTKD